jgi:tetratricopeptide (TPR) repeat protein
MNTQAREDGALSMKTMLAIFLAVFVLVLAGCTCTEKSYDSSVKPPPPTATRTAEAAKTPEAATTEPKGSHLEKGIAYAKDGNFFFAIKEYQKAQKANPKDPVPHYYLGIAYSMLERTSKKSDAYKEFKTALDLGLKKEYAESARKWLSEAEKLDREADLRRAAGRPAGVAPITAVAPGQADIVVGAEFVKDAGKMMESLEKVKAAVDSAFTYEAYASRVKSMEDALESFNEKYGEAPEKDSASFRLILKAADEYIKGAAVWKNQLATGSVDESVLNAKWRAATKALGDARRAMK